MKKLSLILLCMVACLHSFSQTKTDDIIELFKLMQTEQIVNNTMDNMAAMIKQQVKGQIQDEGKFKTYMDFVVKESSKVTKQMVYTDMVQIYDKHFTHQDIKEYIAFYKTASGRKMVTALPAVQSDMMQRMTQNYMPQLQTKFRAKLEELSQ